MTKFAIIHAAYIDPPSDYYNDEGFIPKEKALSLVNANINKTMKMLREAGQSKADIAITNEDFADMGRQIRNVDQPDLFGWLINETENRIINELCEIAKKYNMLIAANEYESDENNKIFNTTKLIGRDGAIIGKYRKVHIPSGERFLVQPGGIKPPVMETDIGKIGFSTCYDNIFPEHCRILAMDGADIIIHQTQGWGTGGKTEIETGEAFMRVRAAENSVYFIVAKNLFNEGGMSCIYDNHGNLISSMRSPTDNVFLTDIELDFEMCDIYHYDNYFAGFASVRARHLIMREPGTYSRLLDDDPVFNTKTLKESKMSDKNKWESDIKALETMDPQERSKYYW